MPKRPVLCVDLDGTLCDERQRHHLNPRQNPTKTRTDYHMACLEDSPVAAVVAIVHALAGTHSVHIVSGRDDIARDLTLTWLARHAIPYDVLRLRRPAELPLKNWQLKAQYVKGLMRQGYERILFLDDSPQVAENLEVIPGVMVLCVDSRYQKPYVS